MKGVEKLWGPGAAGQGDRKGGRYVEAQDRSLDVDGPPEKSGCLLVKMGQEWGHVEGGRWDATGH